LFNADMIRVLTNAGVMRFLQEKIHAVIEELKAGKDPKMPTIKVTAEKAVEAAGFTNPYGAAKAYAALKIAEGVADVTVKGCFVEQEMEKYIPLVASGHEMMRAAAILSDEARELEKSMDALLRTPHNKKGALQKKTKLGDKPA
ncbi:MAG: F420-dependent methylenetetrahydromethanopterin dehydrogenase, partial [Candidatus Thorarchaeota archaeon]